MISCIIISFYLNYISVYLTHNITSKRTSKITCVATFGLRHWNHEMKPCAIISRFHSIYLDNICHINKN